MMQHTLPLQPDLVGCKGGTAFSSWTTASSSYCICSLSCKLSNQCGDRTWLGGPWLQMLVNKRVLTWLQMPWFHEML